MTSTFYIYIETKKKLFFFFAFCKWSVILRRFHVYWIQYFGMEVFSRVSTWSKVSNFVLVVGSNVTTGNEMYYLRLSGRGNAYRKESTSSSPLFIHNVHSWYEYWKKECMCIELQNVWFYIKNERYSSEECIEGTNATGGVLPPVETTFRLRWSNNSVSTYCSDVLGKGPLFTE